MQTARTRDTYESSSGSAAAYIAIRKRHVLIDPSEQARAIRQHTLLQARRTMHRHSSRERRTRRATSYSHTDISIAAAAGIRERFSIGYTPRAIHSSSSRSGYICRVTFASVCVCAAATPRGRGGPQRGRQPQQHDCPPAVPQFHPREPIFIDHPRRHTRRRCFSLSALLLRYRISICIYKKSKNEAKESRGEIDDGREVSRNHWPGGSWLFPRE